MRSRLSILGLYRYDEKVFDGLKVPTGVSRSNVINTILLNCAELEVLYPDWDMMQFAIKQWSDRRQDVWTRLQATTQYDYDPIANYDRREEWTDSARGTNKGNVETVTDATVSGTGEMSTAGFNTDEYKPHDRNETSGTDSRTGTSSSSGSDTHDSEHSGRVYGNIGVVTTQRLITEQREVSEFNMVEYIAEEFRTEFCLLVY